jgi:hypothetical protein
MRRSYQGGGGASNQKHQASAPRSVVTRLRQHELGDSTVWVIFGPAVWTFAAFLALFFLIEQQRAQLLESKT